MERDRRIQSSSELLMFLLRESMKYICGDAEQEVEHFSRVGFGPRVFVISDNLWT